MTRIYGFVSKTGLSSLAFSLLLAGCSVGPKYKAPTPGLAPFHNHVEAPPAKDTSATLEQWWTGFNDPMLVTVVQRALNQKFATGCARAGAGYPQINSEHGPRNRRPAPRDRRRGLPGLPGC